MATLADLKKNLETSSAARARFLSSLLDHLEKNGVDVKDEKVLKSLGLHLDLTNSPAFIKGLAGSSFIITITA